jgi:hypothetical protein
MKNDWKKEMDALVAFTTKNWSKTGKRKCATGVTGTLELGVFPAKKKKKDLDNGI